MQRERPFLVGRDPTRSEFLVGVIPRIRTYKRRVVGDWLPNEYVEYETEAAKEEEAAL